MESDGFEFGLERIADDRVSLVLRGTLEGASLPGLSDGVAALLAELPSGAGILVDLTEVERCDSAACRTLARLQRKFKGHRCRTAWLARRPRLRGAAWWIVHAARDPQAMPVARRHLAEDWLGGSGERLDQVSTNTRDAFDRAERAFARRGAEP